MNGAKIEYYWECNKQNFLRGATAPHPSKRLRSLFLPPPLITMTVARASERYKDTQIGIEAKTQRGRDTERL